MTLTQKHLFVAQGDVGIAHSGKEGPGAYPPTLSAT